MIEQQNKGSADFESFLSEKELQYESVVFFMISYVKYNFRS